MPFSVLKPGFHVARYEVVRPIGTGATSTVYEALDESLGRRVAIKIRYLPEGDPAARRALARFHREARAAREIQHPHVVPVFDFGVDGPLAFIVMELVEGETLAQLLKREGRLSPERALGVLLPVVSAAAKLHAAGILHRDIKPANILLGATAAPAPKLTDFGLSRFVEEASSLTESGAVLGTPDYLAPELVQHASHANDRTDQYALGVMLYECLTGQRPFRGDTPYERMHAIVRGDALPPSKLAPAVSPAHDALVARAMHLDPRQRFESVDELAQAMAAAAPPPLAADWRRTVAGQEATREARAENAERPRWELLVHDGVAVAAQGDAVVVLWQAPATMSRVLWNFDQVDRLAAQVPGGIVALVILLPSSSPPDAETALECMRRIHRLRPSMRRQANVAVGGGVWMTMIGAVLRAMRLPISDQLTISATVEGGIGRALQKRGPATPPREAIDEAVVELHRALDARP